MGNKREIGHGHRYTGRGVVPMAGHYCGLLENLHAAFAGTLDYP